MDAIQILMKEYDTLRAEIIARTSSLYQFWGIGIGLGIALISVFKNIDWHVVTTISLAGIALILATIRSFFDMSMIGARLREIEDDVNSRAGERLLKWESVWASGVTGWLIRKRPRSN